MPAALETLRALKDKPPRATGTWDLPKVLIHAAQSVEYSIGDIPMPPDDMASDMHAGAEYRAEPTDAEVATFAGSTCRS